MILFSKERLRRYLLVLGAFTLYCFWQTFQNTARVPGVSAVVLFVMELPVWYWWAAFMPLIFAISRRFRLEGNHWPAHALVHVCFAIIIPPLWLTAVNASRDLMIPLLLDSPFARDAATIDYLTPNAPFFVSLFRSWRVFLAFPFTLYFSTVALEHAWTYQTEVRRRAERQRQLELDLAQANLAQLKAQLRPHFIFNTLNSISAMTVSDPVRARDMIGQLGDMLRESLDDGGRHEVPLADELASVEKYSAIQRSRFGDRLVIDTDIEPGTAEILVPRMTLQPLVENSIVHGASIRNALRVRIHAHRAGDALRLSVEDNGVGVSDLSQLREGIGIGNLRKRLRHLYGDAASLELGGGDGFRVTMQLPITT